jgi:hypothetical protein
VKRHACLGVASLAAALGGCAPFPLFAPFGDQAPVEAREPEDPLFTTVSALDEAVFDAFNKCAAPDQLRRHARYFAPDVEFYHDTGGVTWTRQAMLANTKKNACGKYRRELVAGSLKVFPVKDFGAIAQGVHRFCQLATGRCDGMADFTIVWRYRHAKWEITRVLSYGHRPNR